METPPAIGPNFKQLATSQFYIELPDEVIWQYRGATYGWQRVALKSELSDVAFSGLYADLIGLPDIPAEAPVQSVNGRIGDVVGLAEQSDLDQETSERESDVFTLNDKIEKSIVMVSDPVTASSSGQNTFVFSDTIGAIPFLVLVGKSLLYTIGMTPSDQQGTASHDTVTGTVVVPTDVYGEDVKVFFKYIGGTSNIPDSVVLIGDLWDYFNTILPIELTNVSGLPVVTSAYRSNAGVETSNAAYKYLSIDITDNKDIYVTSTTSGNQIFLAVYVDVLGAVLGAQFQAANGVDSVFVDQKLTIPSNTHKVYVNAKSASTLLAKKYEFVLAANNEEFQELKEYALENLPLLIDANSDYININATLIDGKYINSSYVETVNAAYRYTTVDIVDSDKIRVTSTTNGGQMYLAIYKDSLGDFIGRQNQGTNGVDAPYTDYELTIPAGTTQVIVQGRVNKSLIVYKKGIVKAATQTQLTSVANDVTSINGRVSSVETTLKAYIAQTLTYLTGYQRIDNTIGGGSYHHVDFPAVQGDLLKVSSIISGSVVYLAVYKNSSNTVIGQQVAGPGGGATATYTDFLLTIPANTATVSVNAILSADIVLKKYQTIDPATKQDIAAVNTRIDNVSVQSYWFSKKIWWCGTSIPATGYPELVGGIFGATMYNVAKSSSMSRRGKFTTTETDPYGWTNIAWQNVGYSLSSTLAEKEDLITNWESKWRDLLGGAFIGDPDGTKPVTLSDADKTAFRDSSYENKLIPYLDGTFPMPDLFVFDHGHNDNLSQDDDATFTSVPASSRNRNTFIGSINYLIDIIFSYQPRARIAFIGHYENDRKTRVSVAQINLAEYWDFKLIRLWDKLGWTQQISTDTSYWTDVNTWNASGGSLTAKTQTQKWLFDDLHPRSIPAKTLIANTISVEMEKIR